MRSLNPRLGYLPSGRIGACSRALEGTAPSSKTFRIVGNCGSKRRSRGTSQTVDIVG